MTRAQGRTGFTLAELLVAVIVASVLMISIFQILLANQRIYTVQREQIQAQQTVRFGLDVLVGELRQASPEGGDLLGMEADRVRFRAFRAAGIGCDWDGTDLTVAPLGRDFQAQEAVFLFVEGNPETAADDYWARGSIASLQGEDVCPVGAAQGDPQRRAQVLRLQNLTPAPAVNAVRSGALLRSFEVFEYGSMVGPDGRTYLGRTELDGDGVPVDVAVPLVGPVIPNRGVLFQYLDGNGQPTGTATAVRSIQVTVQTGSPARLFSGEPVRDSLSVVVHTRN
jgi:prepilin-type N-terminal cleavage/methylation domain-containing protein